MADSGETGAKAGARTGGATAPTTDPDYKSPAPEDTPVDPNYAPAAEATCCRRRQRVMARPYAKLKLTSRTGTAETGVLARRRRMLAVRYATLPFPVMTAQQQSGPYSLPPTHSALFRSARPLLHVLEESKVPVRRWLAQVG